MKARGVLHKCYQVGLDATGASGQCGDSEHTVGHLGLQPQHEGLHAAPPSLIPTVCRRNVLPPSPRPFVTHEYGHASTRLPVIWVVGG